MRLLPLLADALAGCPSLQNGTLVDTFSSWVGELGFMTFERQGEARRYNVIQGNEPHPWQMN